MIIHNFDFHFLFDQILCIKVLNNFFKFTEYKLLLKMNSSEIELRYMCTKGRPQKFSFYLLEGC